MPASFRHLDDTRQTCSRCALARLCLPHGLDSAEVARLEANVDVGRQVTRNSALFSQGEALTAIYAVDTGALKTSMVNRHGLEQITGFYYPGELLGLDGLTDGAHQCSATALEDSTVCRIPFERLDALLDELPALRRQIMRLMSQALSNNEQMLLSLGCLSSTGRMASLLIGLSSQRAIRGMSFSPVHLSMKRADLANFLGMRIETVSRVLRKLQENGIIRVDRSLVDILDFRTLRRWSSSDTWGRDQ